MWSQSLEVSEVAQDPLNKKKKTPEEECEVSVEEHQHIHLLFLQMLTPRDTDLMGPPEVIQ